MLPRSFCPPRSCTVSANAVSLRRRATLGELDQHVVQELNASQTRLALAVLADQVHAVVPVAAAHQRQAVRAELKAVGLIARTQWSYSVATSSDRAGRS